MKLGLKTKSLMEASCNQNENVVIFLLLPMKSKHITVYLKWYDSHLWNTYYISGLVTETWWIALPRSISRQIYLDKLLERRFCVEGVFQAFLRYMIILDKRSVALHNRLLRELQLDKEIQEAYLFWKLGTCSSQYKQCDHQLLSPFDPTLSIVLPEKRGRWSDG